MSRLYSSMLTPCIISWGFIAGAAIASPMSASAQTAEYHSAADDELSEVVVTANRRSEDVQKVGISVAAISGDTLSEFNVTRAEDMAKFVPNLAAIPNAGTATTSYSIRGVSQADAAEHE